jgi:hypothetical protein
VNLCVITKAGTWNYTEIHREGTEIHRENVTKNKNLASLRLCGVFFKPFRIIPEFQTFIFAEKG